MSNAYDYTLGGINLLAATSPDFPYRRSTSPIRKQQFDASESPGEQTISNWWLRSQFSAHYGAGVKYMEPIADDVIANSVADSYGLDLFSFPGQVRVMRDYTNYYSSTGAIGKVHDLQLVGTSNPSLWFRTNDGALRTGSTGAVVLDNLAGNCISFCSDGTNYYATDGTTVTKGAVSTATTVAAATLYTISPASSSDSVLAWVKSRLILASSNGSIYELSPAGGSLPPPIYTSPITSSGANGFFAVTEGPDAFYVLGLSAMQSVLWKFVLSTSGASPVLSSAVPAFSFDRGELVRDMVVWGGKYLVVSSTQGVRVGEIQPGGSVEFGPMTLRGGYFGNLSATRNYIYVSASEGDIKEGDVGGPNPDDVATRGHGGLLVLDLTRPKPDGTFPWHHRSRYLAVDGGNIAFKTLDVVSAINDVTGDPYLYQVGQDGLTPFRIGQVTEANNRVGTAWLRTPHIRYNTLEKKYFLYITVKTDPSSDGTLSIYTVNASGTETLVTSFSANTGGITDFPLGRPAAEESLALKFVFTTPVGVNSKGPILLGWQVKSLPMPPKRQRDIRLPILLFENMKDRKGARVPVTDIDTLLTSLETLENTGAPVTFTRNGPSPPVSETVTVESVDFIETSPPAGAAGRGGIVYLTLRSTGV